ncbi:MAG: EAL domain-containing protein [Sulfuricurvum sp.]
MYLINHRYKNDEMLEEFIAASIPKDKTIFIQVYSGLMENETIRPVLESLKRALPDSALIGATTAGEIMDGKLSGGEIVISFSVFESTTVGTYYYPGCDYETGKQIARERVTDRTKLCIVFSEGLKCDSESFLKGFTSVAPDTVLAGGNAGDDLTFTRTYIMKDDTIYDKGIVAAVFESDVLEVKTAYSLNWTPIGKRMTVTKADKNVIYEIDGMSVRDLYIHYLGQETVEKIPASAIEFPLIKTDEAVQIARSLIGQMSDGGFVYAGHFSAGDKVRFAIGNVQDILDKASDIQATVASAPAEATYIYSCSVRKLFLQDQLNYEFGLIEEIAPTAGFFTYGEFYHASSKNFLLNITTTTITLSEGSRQREFVPTHKAYNHSMLKSLTHLVNETQKELDDNIRILDQYKMVLDESSIVSKTDSEGYITYVNDEFCRISGYTRDELMGQRHSIVLHPDNPQELFTDLWDTVSQGKIWKATFKNRSKAGQDYYVKSVIAPIFDDHGLIVEYIAARVDVTDLISQAEIILKQRTDSLTGLKNRTALFDDLAELGDEVLLVVVNIDQFSNVNDYFGYEVGDNLLRLFARKLSRVIDHEYFYRISGDEFVFRCKDAVYDEYHKDKILDKLSYIQNQKFRIGENRLTVNVTAGVAFAAKHEVYNLAHMALKEAKERREGVTFYNDNATLSEKTHNNILVVNKIKAAIAEDRIVPFYQGIVDNTTREIVKYEALIRLIEPDGRVLSPYAFLEHAKKAKLYDQLTRIVISKTLAMFEPLDFEVGINLTLQDILSEETRVYLYETLRESPVAKRITFEIVESEGIESFEEISEFIRRVRSYGCKIAIDDFGSGYSNFSYLSKLDVDYIKIDGSLVKNINDGNDHLYTVESILFFARKKGIRTIAEFVENEAIFETLKSLNIDYSQGYLFSVPSAGL